MRPAVTQGAHWRFPTPRVEVLSNGLTIWLFDLPGQLVGAADLVLPTPLSVEPREIEGVATIALSAIDEGTVSNPDGRIAELLELHGASLSGAAHTTSTRISIDAPIHRMAPALELFTEMLVEPAYGGDDIRRHKEWQVAAFETRMASPAAVAGQTFAAALYGEHARPGRPAAGTPETITAIDLLHVKAWHARYYSPTSATFVLAGDLRGIDTERLLEPLSCWRGGGPGDGEEARTTPGRRVLVDSPGAVQATMHLGCGTVGRTHPDWAALKLAGHALAGAFTSRLNLELRERRGATYGVSGGFRALPGAGQFRVTGSFEVEALHPALEATLSMLELDEPFSETQIDEVRRYLVGIGPLANETAADIATQAASLATAGLTSDYVNHHIEALKEPTASEVGDAFRRHVDISDLTIAVTGPADDLMPGLEPHRFELH